MPAFALAPVYMAHSVVPVRAVDCCGVKISCGLFRQVDAWPARRASADNACWVSASIVAKYVPKLMAYMKDI